jgi:hypothetical protein
MKIVLGSMIRKPAPDHLARFFRQVGALGRHFSAQGHQLSVVLVEGDSHDGGASAQAALAWAWAEGIELDLLRCDHGGPVHGSVETTERLRDVTVALNAVFGGMARREGQAGLYVESDLVWTVDALGGLYDRWAAIQYHALNYVVTAPMVMAADAFYDTWGFRALDGTRFGPHPPFTADFDATHPFEVSSVGSCFCFSLRLAEQHAPPGEALAGWCESIRRNDPWTGDPGASIYVTPDIVVHHP